MVLPIRRLLFGVLLGGCLNAPAFAVYNDDAVPMCPRFADGDAVSDDASAPSSAQVGGTLYLCYSPDTGKLVLLRAIGGKMQHQEVPDTNGDGVIDTSDAPSSAVIFIGETPTKGGNDEGGVDKTAGDSGPAKAPLLENPGGGGRRIMWRQIQ